MSIIHIILAAIAWLLLPTLGVSVSFSYYRSAAHLPLPKRVAVSSAGAVLALFYLTSMLVAFLGRSSENWVVPYSILFLVPLGLMGYALIGFRGAGTLHLLQLVNTVNALFTFSLGIMAVRGSWH